jgi:RNA polymerase sigma-70 factor (ECF subfamily)
MVQTRAQLGEALGAGRAGLARLIGEIAPIVQARVARALLRRRQQAAGRELRQELEDLTQEVLLALFDDDARVLRSWDPERGLSLKNFVGMVAERQVASILRSGRRSPWSDDPTNDELLEARLEQSNTNTDTVEIEVARRELLEQVLDRMLEQLSPLGRALFEAIFVHEQPVAHICRSMGLRPDAVWAWRSRLTRRARTILAELLCESNPLEPVRERKATR